MSMQTGDRVTFKHGLRVMVGQSCSGKTMPLWPVWEAIRNLYTSSPVLVDVPRGRAIGKSTAMLRRAFLQLYPISTGMSDVDTRRSLECYLRRADATRAGS